MFNNSEIDNWIIERHGNLTASKIDVIIPPGTNGKLFTVGGYNYIKRVAIEAMTELWEKPDLDEVKSLLHGKVFEEPAYHWYCKVSRNYYMRYFGTLEPIYLPFNSDSGGSPDGMMGEGENVYLGLELKCPKNSEIHFDYLKMKTQWDLKEYSLNYYAQMQFLMMIMKTKEFHFASFDDRVKNPALKMKILEIKYDQKFCDNLHVRVLQAIKEKYKIIEMYQNLKQAI